MTSYGRYISLLGVTILIASLRSSDDDNYDGAVIYDLDIDRKALIRTIFDMLEYDNSPEIVDYRRDTDDSSDDVTETFTVLNASVCLFHTNTGPYYQKLSTVLNDSVTQLETKLVQEPFCSEVTDFVLSKTTLILVFVITDIWSESVCDFAFLKATNYVVVHIGVIELTNSTDDDDKSVIVALSSPAGFIRYQDYGDVENILRDVVAIVDLDVTMHLQHPGLFYPQLIIPDIETMAKNSTRIKDGRHNFMHDPGVNDVRDLQVMFLMLCMAFSLLLGVISTEMDILIDFHNDSVTVDPAIHPPTEIRDIIDNTTVDDN